MDYKVVCGERISRLGMGNMRLPTTDGGARGAIDEVAASAVIDRVMAAGVNYYDTAYMYHGGESEKFLGRALARYPRESYYLADKMPGMMLGEQPDRARVAEVFEEQLGRCRTDYFDFYLLHNVSGGTIKRYLDRDLDIVGYLLEQKRAGRIRHLGFSSHSSPEDLARFLDAYPAGTFEFVQIQLNYLDWTLQRAAEQYDIIVSHGLPVWVMEPCRGGRLASLCPEADAMLRAAQPDRTVASWAFRFVGSLPDVGVILSGMTEQAQADDNIATFSGFQPFTDDERKTLDGALALLRRMLTVPCTGCRYCDGCPVGLDIPALIAEYNTYRMDGGSSALRRVAALPENGRPSACIGCGACASACPQGIAVPDVMKLLSSSVDEWEKKRAARA